MCSLFVEVPEIRFTKFGTSRDDLHNANSGTKSQQGKVESQFLDSKATTYIFRSEIHDPVGMNHQNQSHFNTCSNYLFVFIPVTLSLSFPTAQNVAHGIATYNHFTSDVVAVSCFFEVSIVGGFGWGQWHSINAHSKGLSPLISFAEIEHREEPQRYGRDRLRYQQEISSNHSHKSEMNKK